MAQATAIEWTDVSWNPVHGCSKVSPGCAHCYAETLSRRYKQTTAPWTPANAEQNVLLKPHKLREPLSRAKPWDRPCRVFVNSMSDLFHELVPDEYIADVFAVMMRAPQHTFQVLTKRPERMRDLLAGGIFPMLLEDAFARAGVPAPRPWDDDWPVPPNVWLGTSIENRRFVSRADAVRATPAAVRFISAEPLLGPLVPIRTAERLWTDGRYRVTHTWDDARDHGPGLSLRGIDWLIVGGESGPGHRPIKADWVRDLRDAALEHDTAFFFKQWGGATPKAGGRELDGRTWDEMPAVAAPAKKDGSA